MSDYARQYDFSPKDALATGDPLKLILGSEADAEFDAIVTAIATKYDSSDLASQAQAQAAASNAVLMTPARVSDWAQANSGILYDLQLLSDPNADRIVFWDDSAGAGAFLSLGTGLAISGTELQLSLAAIDHDSLSGFVADEHVAHSGVTFSAGEGLTGGGTIAANRSFALALSSLTQETTFDTTNDMIAFYDASAGAHRKTPLGNLYGVALGDGKWYLGSNKPLSSTLSTITSLTEAYDDLTRGTFDAAAGTYTAGASGARIQVWGSFRILNVNSGDAAYCQIQVDGTAKAEDRMSSAGGSEDVHLKPMTVLTLTVGQVVRFQAAATSSETITSGESNAFICIIELA